MKKSVRITVVIVLAAVAGLFMLQEIRLNFQNRATTDGMTIIPASPFLMGRADREGWSPMADPAQFNDELPAHEVYIDTFYMDKRETTNAQFKEFTDFTGYVTEAERDGSSMVIVPAGGATEPVKGTDIGWKETEGADWRHPEGPGSGIEGRMDHPVVHVSWNDAVAYARWAGKRLPTEAEWEKAARAGRDTNWFWGDRLDGSGQYANIYGEHRLDYSYPAEVLDGFDGTAPVGSLIQNAYDLYDTAGNVWEWTADTYRYDYFSNSPPSNPKGPETGTEKVIKGGGWNLCECYTRPANRQPMDGHAHDSATGFRLALDK